MPITLSSEERATLLGSPFLTGAPSTLVDEILSHPSANLSSFVSGETVYTPHAFQRCLGILLSGSLKVQRESLFVSLLRAGDLFGAAALYSDSQEYTANLTGNEGGRILLLDYSLVDSLIASSPLVRENYLRYLTGRIRFLNGRLHSVAAGDGEGKLARYLLFAPDPRCSATELAHRLGMGRATLYRAFQSMEEAGAIARSGRSITILDQSILETFV